MGWQARSCPIVVVESMVDRMDRTVPPRHRRRSAVAHEITRRAFLTAASCSLVPRVYGQSSSSWRTSVTELENLIPPLMAEAKVPGLGIAVVNAGRLVW